jgi:hypothetical protein
MSIKPLLAAMTMVAGLAASQAAQSAYVYNLNAIAGDGLPDFVLTVPALISTDPTDFQLTDFDSYALPPA